MDSLETSRQAETNMAPNGCMWKKLLRDIRKPCLVVDFDLHLSVHPDYDTAPEPALSGDNQKSTTSTDTSSRPICDKSETGHMKWRVADMVMWGTVMGVAMSAVCCIKHLCCGMKK